MNKVRVCAVRLSSCLRTSHCEMARCKHRFSTMSPWGRGARCRGEKCRKVCVDDPANSDHRTRALLRVVRFQARGDYCANAL
jgi:hypothetical protein